MAIKVIEGNYANGMKDGLWSYFFENGKKDMNGSFKNGNRTEIGNFGIPTVNCTTKELLIKATRQGLGFSIIKMVKHGEKETISKTKKMVHGSHGTKMI